MATVPITMTFADEQQYAISVWSLCSAYGYADEPLPDLTTLQPTQITPGMIAFARSRIASYVNDVVTGAVAQAGDVVRSEFVQANDVDVVMT